MKFPAPFVEGTDHINAIIETPKGSRNKYVYDSFTEFFKLKKALPAGLMFPFDFGFVPSTMAQDGDPLDILVLTDAATYPGCLIEARVLGVIKVEQEKKGDVVRNDRVIGVQVDSRDYSSANTIDELPDGLIHEIVHFFASYNNVSKDVFRHLGNEGPKVAIDLVRRSIAAKENGTAP